MRLWQRTLNPLRSWWFRLACRSVVPARNQSHQRGGCTKPYCLIDTVYHDNPVSLRCRILHRWEFADAVPARSRSPTRIPQADVGVLVHTTACTCETGFRQLSCGSRQLQPRTIASIAPGRPNRPKSVSLRRNCRTYCTSRFHGPNSRVFVCPRLS